MLNKPATAREKIQVHLTVFLPTDGITCFDGRYRRVATYPLRYFEPTLSLCPCCVKSLLVKSTYIKKPDNPHIAVVSESHSYRPPVDGNRQLPALLLTPLRHS